MLKLVIPDSEWYDDDNSEFILIKGGTIMIEHSLVAVSKWESRWCRPFLEGSEKTFEESIDYIRCMTITQNVPDSVYLAINSDIISKVNAYIESPMTATIVPKRPGSGVREEVTSELIYYWMITLNIPMECQKWHLERLLTLIKVCNFKNTPPEKLSKKELLARNRAENEARRRKYNTKG